MEEIHRSGCNGGAAHAQMYTMGTILKFGSEEQKQNYLPKIATGELRLQAFGVSEPNSGTDTLSLETTAIENDDELWGELNRVTDFGAYIEVGAEVDGFLHYMDHPLWIDGMHPSGFMSTGQRVRVWVADVDQGQRRVRLTANRPQHLPGPRRER